MLYEEVLILIPSHGIEDFPTDLEEEHASGLLNAFAVACHPWILANCDRLPQAHRSDDPPEQLSGRLLFVPPISEDWLPHGWADEAHEQGAKVISGVSAREDYLAEIERIAKATGAPNTTTNETHGEQPSSGNPPPTVSPDASEESPGQKHNFGQPDTADLVADFLALGMVRLFLELLTQHMHHFDIMDDEAVGRDALPAAQALLNGDLDETRDKLRSAFETLTETRERFYPVECYLLDVCLMSPDADPDSISQLLDRDCPTNFLLSGDDLTAFTKSQPELTARMAEQWQQRAIDFVGGEQQEIPVPLVPLRSAIADFEFGRETFQKHLGRVPKTWGRRRYGFSTQLPQLLRHFDYHCALHVALDDGLYPDDEQGKVSWEGCDGTVIDSTTRLPIAADSAASFLRLPGRLAETIEQDMIAALMFARWPDMRTPWLSDILRMHRYSPALGRWVTFNDFAQETDAHGRHASFQASEYLAPFLIQTVVRKIPDSISRFARHFVRNALVEQAGWLDATARVLMSQPVEHPSDLLARIERCGPDEPVADSSAEGKSVAAGVDEEILAWHQKSLQKLGEIIAWTPTSDDQLLFINPDSFARKVVVTESMLSQKSPTESHSASPEHSTIVDVPGCGFRSIAAAELGQRLTNQSGNPLVEGYVLRNEFFEIVINEITGGIARIKRPNRRGNRLSQQLAYRFPNELTWSDAETGEEFSSFYSVMSVDEISADVASPSVGKISSRGRLVNPADKSVVANFQQTITVHRGMSAIRIDMELSDLAVQPDGDPWSNYFACRFAWNDSGASITRSIFGQAHAQGNERIESPHYVEIASDDGERTTIATAGRPYHRRTDLRMLDSLLIVGSETSRRWSFLVELDNPFPQQVAQQALSCVPIHRSQNAAADSGWLFHVDAKNVRIDSLHPLQPVPMPGSDDTDSDETNLVSSAAMKDTGFAVRLIETEGRRARVELRTFRTPKLARQRTFDGRTVSDLLIEGDAVITQIAGYEIIDVELRF